MQPLPEIDLDVFKICIYRRWKVGELMYYSLAVLFGAFQFPCLRAYCYRTSGPQVTRRTAADFLAFSIIALAARRTRMNEYEGIPSILKTILRDGTQYFILIFSAHVLSMLFLFFAPVGGVCHVQEQSLTFHSSHSHFQENVQLMPAMLVPFLFSMIRCLSGG